MDEQILGRKNIRISGGALSKDFVAKFELVVTDDLTEQGKNAHAMKSIVIEYQKIRDEGNEASLRELEAQGTVTIKASECAGDPLAKALGKMSQTEKDDLRKRLIAEYEAQLNE